MGNHAYVKLVPASKQTSITLHEVKDLMDKYLELSKKTGEQNNWDYENSSFPYNLEMPPHDEGSKLKLVSKRQRFEGLTISVEQEQIQNEDGNKTSQDVIKVSLYPTSTYGDKDRAIDYCKFMAKKLAGELHLFNERIMYFYNRK